MKTWLTLFHTLKDPLAKFHKLPKQTLDSNLKDYLKNLGFLALIAVIAHFSYTVLRAIVYSFFDVHVLWPTFLNYTLGQAVGVGGFIIYAGTFGFLFLSAILALFFKLKYAEFCKVFIVALSPLLAGAWILPLAPGLIAWSGWLLITGAKEYGRANKKEKGTIRERE